MLVRNESIDCYVWLFDKRYVISAARISLHRPRMARFPGFQDPKAHAVRIVGLLALGYWLWDTGLGGFVIVNPLVERAYMGVE